MPDVKKTITPQYIETCDVRRHRVERILAILYTATNGPDNLFMDALEDYIEGVLTIDELESRVDEFKYLGLYL